MHTLPLHPSILHTLVFFDLFDAGLTAEEVHRYLWQGAGYTLADVAGGLRSLTADGLIVYDRGYYGFRALADVRVCRIAHLEHKQQIALRAAKKLRYVPFIRAVFGCNNLALETVRSESDVDVFIIVQPGRMWIARLLATLVLRWWRLARTRTKDINRVCLSFYATTDAIDMSGITITDPDIYLMYWVRSLVPLYDPCAVYEVIQQANGWIAPYVSPYKSHVRARQHRVEDTAWSVRVRTICERMWTGVVGDAIEQQAKELQKTKMKFRWGSVRDEPDSRVIISDDMLKFHENDRRVQYKEEWEDRVKNHITYNI